MRLLLSLAALAVLCAAPSAFADSVTFNLDNGSFSPTGTITGTVTIDTTAGTFISADLEVMLGGKDYYFIGPFSNSHPYLGDTQYLGTLYDNSGDSLALDLPVTTLAGYTGSTVCSVANLCSGTTVGNFDPDATVPDAFATGSLDPAPTPEPSSFILLATGALGMGGAIRRKLSR